MSLQLQTNYVKLLEPDGHQNSLQTLPDMPYLLVCHPEIRLGPKVSSDRTAGCQIARPTNFG